MASQTVPMLFPALWARAIRRSVAAAYAAAGLQGGYDAGRVFCCRCSRSNITGARIKQAHVHHVPLHIDLATDPARRRTIIGRFNFNTTIDMDRALSVLVIAERLQRQRLQVGLLFGEHRRHLPLGAAMDARVGPVLFPVIQICLRLFQALEASCPSAASSAHGRHRDSTFPFRSGSRTLQGSAVTP